MKKFALIITGAILILIGIAAIILGYTLITQRDYIVANTPAITAQPTNLPAHINGGTHYATVNTVTEIDEEEFIDLLASLGIPTDNIARPMDDATIEKYINILAAMEENPNKTASFEYWEDLASNSKKNVYFGNTE